MIHGSFISLQALWFATICKDLLSVRSSKRARALSKQGGMQGGSWVLLPISVNTLTCMLYQVYRATLLLFFVYFLKLRKWWRALQKWNACRSATSCFRKVWKDFTLHKVPSRYTGETRGEVFTKMKSFCFLKYCWTLENNNENGKELCPITPWDWHSQRVGMSLLHAHIVLQMSLAQWVNFELKSYAQI